MHEASVIQRVFDWRAQVRRLGYPPRHKTFDAHAEAEAWARVFEPEMDCGIFASRVEVECYNTEIRKPKGHHARKQTKVA